MLRDFYSSLNYSIIASISICIGVLTTLNLNSLSSRSAISPNCFSGSFACTEKNQSVEFTTTKGKILVKLFGSVVPLTAGNFIDLVRRGVYNNTVFHHIIRQLKPFVVEGGDTRSDILEGQVNILGNGYGLDTVIGGPRSIPIEIVLDGDPEPIYGKTITSIENKNRIKLLHNRGTLAMLRSQEPNSVSTRFYIVLRPLPELDGRYSILGQVENGMETIDKIVKGDKIIRVTILEDTK